MKKLPIENNQDFPITEIFTSVQGEGFHSGKFALFIRFGKCNLKCDFCDTKYAWDNYKFISEKAIFKILDKNIKITNFLIITGGEPTLYNLMSIVNYAKNLGYYISVESNGTLYKEWLEKVDWITISPKNRNINKKILNLANELKFVIVKKKDFKLVEYFMPFKMTILQPVDNNQEIAKQILQYIKKSRNKESLRLGIQIHKVYQFK